MELLTIIESHNSNDLLVLKTKLESEGIQCILKDQYTSQILTHIPSMSVKLQVYEKDIEKVKNIMVDIGESFQIIEDIHCPVCNSTDVDLKLNNSDRLKLFFIYAKSQLLFTKPKSIKSKTFICQACGKIFKH